MSRVTTETGNFGKNAPVAVSLTLSEITNADMATAVNLTFPDGVSRMTLHALRIKVTDYGIANWGINASRNEMFVCHPEM